MSNFDTLLNIQGYKSPQKIRGTPTYHGCIYAKLYNEPPTYKRR